MKNSLSSITRYHALLKSLDSSIESIIRTYPDDIACRKGCASCCILGSVCAVEGYILHQFLVSLPERSKKGMIARAEAHPGDNEACVLLEKGVCRLYEHRPVICRTHGFPIFIDDMIDFCGMNFLNLEEIDIDLIIDLEELNTRLAEINIEFIKESPDPRFKKERIPLRDIVAMGHTVET